ncbi:MAG: oxygen-independent coproporphyrinogen III oxidase-like protein [Betaproteobacteria bacterium]|nr:oxygen-independent coproporphyrinogen III oxidase-like protein [Betaproteobacteria bacterium]MBV9361943.1 oxygen-independent coproporphyrinogen III oxidase-like protein [Betaproteobacteria bacterium]
MPQIAIERPGQVVLTALPPLALYAHIPWCVRKCPYCDFNSHERTGDLPEREYVAKLIADLEALLPSVWGRRVVSIFIGGGTPSLFSPEAIDALLSGMRARVAVDPMAEITLEANPGTVEAARFRGFRAAGVNRISVGVQSFDDRMLIALERIHSAQEAKRGVEAALASFDNVNLDLMYGLPDQTIEMAQSDIRAGLAIGVPHISAYQLTIEPNTAFYSRPPTLPDHDASADMQIAVEEALAGAGYERYETSAFARPGHRCKHNLNYWEFGDYLGIGAGAHGKVSFPDRVTRHERIKQPRDYMSASNTLAREGTVAAKELPFEFMLNALRLVDGFPLALFQERTGLPLSRVEPQLKEAEQKGLIKRDWQRVRPTERGRLFLNELLAMFVGGSAGRGSGVRVSDPATRIS